MKDLLRVENLTVEFGVHEGILRAVDNVSFSIPPGGTLALVGESGSGKSVCSQAIMGLLPRTARIPSGSILFEDPREPGNPIDIARLDRTGPEMRAIRGGQISIIFQEPMTSLSALHTVGDQIGEAVELHGGTGTGLSNIHSLGGSFGYDSRLTSTVMAYDPATGEINGLWKGGKHGEGTQDSRQTNQCHDITVYPSKGLAGGACEGHGILLDIRDPANPKRLDAVADSNFAYWHSATFNNDGTKILFSDEWGGGGAPKCRATDKKEWGSDAIFTIENNKMKFQGYYKLPAAQTELENCVAHNGSLIPIPGRDVMVQAWYQGGISVFDWTDAKNPKEIAFFDRGPVDGTHFTMGGSWSVYWYNGSIVSSEIARGMDVAELVPSEHISQNEIDAAKTVKWTYLNAQGQPKITWPPSFPLARAYVDQLERSKGYSPEKLASIRADLSAAEKLSGQARKDFLNKMATGLHADARGSSDAPKAHTLASSVGDLAKL